MNEGVQNFYYTKVLPSKSVAIARIETTPATPAQLISISDTASIANLDIRKSSTSDLSNPDFIAPGVLQSVEITGSVEYKLHNQFFEITNVQLDNGDPAYYVHVISSSIDQKISVLDLDGNIIAAQIRRVGNFVYHSLDGAAYKIRYVDTYGYLHTDVLSYQPVLTISQYSPSSSTYTLDGRFLTVASTSNYWIRFTAHGGYSVIPPYNDQSNTPWYVRVRFGLTPPLPEWAMQIFQPVRPYQLATWVPGVVLDKNLIEFERKQMYFNPEHLPDIIVFDKNYVIKYALDGTKPGNPLKRGTLYNWKRGLIKSVDTYKARIEVQVDLDPTDIAFGFYSYREDDVVFRALDVNPFTNPTVKGTIINFYWKADGVDPIHYLYYQICDSTTGVAITGLTNDSSPSTGTSHVFSTISVGTNINLQNFSIEDIRNRGGGLASKWQDIPQAVNFWDLGFWDGKPYPVGGTLAVYIPASLLDIMSRSDIYGRVQQSLPEGTLAVVHFYNIDGTEFV